MKSNGNGKAKRKIPPEHKIPQGVLVQAANPVLEDRPYHVDSLSTYDLELVRSNCAKADSKYASVNLQDIHQQLGNIRRKGHAKTGLFTRGGSGQPTKEAMLSKYSEWYNNEYTKSDHWIRFRIDYWSRHADKFCRLCGARGIELKLHHSTYYDAYGVSILWNETDEYVIPLCDKCHKRHHQWQPKPPNTDPRTDANLFNTSRLSSHEV